LIEKILDVAGQKGTGKWTVLSSLDIGTPVTVIAEAVFARSLSAHYDDRQQASHVLGTKIRPPHDEKEKFVDELEKALYAAKIISYAQGFWLLRQAAQQFGWNLDLGACALLWRGGCIIRSAFLGKIKEAFEKTPDLSLLILDQYFHNELKLSIHSLRSIISAGVMAGVPLPCFSSALAWYDGMRSKLLPTNLIQAQRDLFGAHTFERVDRPRGEMVHADWHVKEGKEE